MSSYKEPQSREEALQYLRNIDTKPQSTRPPSPQPCDLLLDPAENPEQLPSYTRSESGFREGIEELTKSLREQDSDNLPITSYPLLISFVELDKAENVRRRQRIVNMYFEAIAKADVELLSTLSSQGLVTNETKNEEGKTPLLAAIKAGKVAAVRFLLDTGADINAYGIVPIPCTDLERACKAINELQTHRTPLQYAAQLGNLSLVKLLMEKGANDALIAPDGQLALRLAASNGHREIVAFLPTRRGGGFRRWKAKHATAMRRCRKAIHRIYLFNKFFVWDIPRFFIWSIPKYVIVLPLVKGVKWLRDNVDQIPSMVANSLKSIWSSMKKLPRALWSVVVKIPVTLWDLVKDVGRGIWNVMKGFPHAAKIALVWVWTGIKNIGSALAKVVTSIFSFIHTFCAAIISFFQRITLQDVWEGFVTCLRAIFVDAPKKVWEWLCRFSKALLRGLEALFGGLGKCIWYLLWGIWEIIVFIPKKIGVVIAACGSSITTGGKEMMVWIDPKRV